MSAPLSGQLGTTSHEPMIERIGCGRPIGNHSFLVSFTDDTHGEGLTIQRRHIESAHFGDAQPAGVRQLEYCPVANLGRAAPGCLIPSGVEEHPSIRFIKRRGQPLVGARRGQQSGRVTGQDSLAKSPGREIANRGCVARDRRTSSPVRQRLCEPRTNGTLSQRIAQLFLRGVLAKRQEIQQRAQIREIRGDCVGTHPSPKAQVLSPALPHSPCHAAILRSASPSSRPATRRSGH